MTPTIRNLLILAGTGIGGYFIYRHFFSGKKPADAAELPDNKKSAVASKPAAPPPAHVSKKELVSSKIAVVAQAPEIPGYSYAKVTKSYTDETGATVREFRSPIDGYFTRRFLQIGNNLFAEIKPG